jgi:hypothetical protein
MRDDVWKLFELVCLKNVPRNHDHPHDPHPTRERTEKNFLKTQSVLDRLTDVLLSLYNFANNAK